MNYRHAYHAGSFADVFKHIILVALTQSFLRKATPFCYLDTHAGMGCYDLFSKEAQKSKEFELGISKLILQKNPPELIKDYLKCISKNNIAKNNYPGSPLIVRHFLRPTDRMILSELHAKDYRHLKKCFADDKQVATHHQDAYLSLKAFLPPKERRGFVLIDPPYEKSDEYSQLLTALPDALHRWETGCYALWYPLKNQTVITRFLETLKKKIHHPILITELSIYPDNTEFSLNGCGMLIINPPWQLDIELKQILPWIWQALSVDKQGKYFLDVVAL